MFESVHFTDLQRTTPQSDEVNLKLAGSPPTKLEVTDSPKPELKMGRKKIQISRIGDERNRQVRNKLCSIRAKRFFFLLPDANSRFVAFFVRAGGSEMLNIAHRGRK